MYYVRWIFRLLFFAIIGAFLHYTLPQRDIVQITGTEILRIDVSGWNSMFFAQADSGNALLANRDLRLINTQLPDGDAYVYRNEDTGFGWPPYFKVASSDIQALAQAAARTEGTWYVIRHYGWRSQILSTYPNVVSVREVDGPDVRLIPFFNIAVLLGLFALYWAISVRLKRFWERRIEPLFGWD